MMTKYQKGSLSFRIRKANISDIPGIYKLFQNEKMQGDLKEIKRIFQNSGGIFDQHYNLAYIEKKINNPKNLVLVATIAQNSREIVAGYFCLSEEMQVFANAELNGYGSIFFQQYQNQEMMCFEALDLIVSPNEYKKHNIGTALGYEMALKMKEIYKKDIYMIAEVYAINDNDELVPNISSRNLILKVGGQELGTIKKANKAIVDSRTKRKQYTDILSFVYATNVDMIIARLANIVKVKFDN